MTWASVTHDGANATGGIKLGDKFTVQSLPIMVIVDKSGKIIFREIGGDALDAKLKEILE